MIHANELLNSEIARKMEMQNCPMASQYWKNLLDLMSVLASVRNEFGKSIYITSGYRHPVVNKMVGGAKNSAHMYGLAADVKLLNSEDYLVVQKLFSKFAIKLGYQSIVIFEKPLNGKPSWLHLELSRDKPSRVFTIN